jgi:hypothetical protein
MKAYDLSWRLANLGLSEDNLLHRVVIEFEIGNVDRVYYVDPEGFLVRHSLFLADNGARGEKVDYIFSKEIKALHIAGGCCLLTTIYLPFVFLSSFSLENICYALGAYSFSILAGACTSYFVLSKDDKTALKKYKERKN